MASATTGKRRQGGGDARFWVGVLYPENMREDWQEVLPDLVELPFAYCLHNADRDSKSEHRKDHVHLILAFHNTTTYNHAMTVFNRLSAEGRKAINRCEAVIDIRHKYDYLIHDTDNCRKLGKEPYPPEARITGNNFDIGAFEQLSAADKSAMCVELCNSIITEKFTNFSDFYVHAMEVYVAQNTAYFEIIRTYSGLFERLTRGNFQKWEQGQRAAGRARLTGLNYDLDGENDPSNTTNTTSVTASSPRNHHEEEPGCCPSCGSVDIRKSGRTSANTQRFECKDCGKKFT